MAHLLSGQPIATQMLATRAERVVDEDLEPVPAFSRSQERDGMADVADALGR